MLRLINQETDACLTKSHHRYIVIVKTLTPLANNQFLQQLAYYSTALERKAERKDKEE